MAGNHGEKLGSSLQMGIWAGLWMMMRSSAGGLRRGGGVEGHTGSPYGQRARQGELGDGVQVMKSKRRTTICASEKLCQNVPFLALTLATARPNHGDGNENCFVVDPPLPSSEGKTTE